MLLNLRFSGPASARSLFLFATSNMMMRGLGSVRSSHANLRPFGLNTTELSAGIEPNASTEGAAVGGAAKVPCTKQTEKKPANRVIHRMANPQGARAAPIAYQCRSVCRECHWLPSCHGFVGL